MNQASKNLPLILSLASILVLLALIGTMTIGIDCTGNPNLNFASAIDLASKNQCKY